MRGIATIDRRPDADQVAVWITSRSDLRAANVNAVTIDVADPDVHEKVYSLTRCCVVLGTDGTSVTGLPIDGELLNLGDVAKLQDETVRHQAAILKAIADYKAGSRSRSIVTPTFPRRRDPQEFAPAEGTPAQRAFGTANYVGVAWTAWLLTDEERRRRTVQPRTGLTPWIMPESMSSQHVPDFPPGFAALLHEQALI